MASYVPTNEPQRTFTLVLLDAGRRPVSVISQIRRIRPDLPILVVKAMVDNPPAIVKSDIQEHQVRWLQRDFNDAGARVKLVVREAPAGPA